MCSVSDDALPMPCKKREYVLTNSAINVVNVTYNVIRINAQRKLKMYEV